MGVLHTAGAAPAGPKIYQYIIATEGSQADGIPKCVILCEFRRSMTDAGVFGGYNGFMKSNPSLRLSVSGRQFIKERAGKFRIVVAAYGTLQGEKHKRKR